MAQPNGVRSLGNVPDLGQLRKAPKQGAKEAQIGFELLSGMRCGGCFRRIERGVKLIRFVSKMGPTGPQMKKQMFAACLRDDCDYAKSRKPGCTALEPIEYTWVKGDPDPDGKLCKMITMGKTEPEPKTEPPTAEGTG
jgi:hypothetical protein